MTRMTFRYMVRFIWHRLFGDGVVPMSYGPGFDEDKIRCKCGRLVPNRVKWVTWPIAPDGSSGALLVEKRLTEKEKEEIRARFQERYGGGHNAYRAWQEDEA